MRIHTRHAAVHQTYIHEAILADAAARHDEKQEASDKEQQQRQAGLNQEVCRKLFHKAMRRQSAKQHS